MILEERVPPSHRLCPKRASGRHQSPHVQSPGLSILAASDAERDWNKHLGYPRLGGRATATASKLLDVSEIEITTTACSLRVSILVMDPDDASNNPFRSWEPLQGEMGV